MKHYLKKVVGIGLACVCAVSLAFMGNPIMSYATPAGDLTIDDATAVGVAGIYVFNDTSDVKRIEIEYSVSRHYKCIHEINGVIVQTLYTKPELTEFACSGSVFASSGLVFPVTLQVVVETMSDESHNDWNGGGPHTYNAIVKLIFVDSSVEGGPWLSEEKAELKQAIKEDKEEEITLTGVSTMDREMSNILKDCKADVILKFQYEGVPHEVLIPAGEAPTEDLDYFGPCWLLGRYGDLLKTPEPYIIQKGDTLKDLADKWGVSVGYLMRLNPYIKDNHWIYVGKTLMH